MSKKNDKPKHEPIIQKDENQSARDMVKEIYKLLPQHLKDKREKGDKSGK